MDADDRGPPLQPTSLSHAFPALSQLGAAGAGVAARGIAAMDETPSGKVTDPGTTPFATGSLEHLKLDLVDVVVEHSQWLACVVQDESRRLQGQLDSVQRELRFLIRPPADGDALRDPRRASSAPGLRHAKCIAEAVAAPMVSAEAAGMAGSAPPSAAPSPWRPEAEPRRAQPRPWRSPRLETRERPSFGSAERDGHLDAGRGAALERPRSRRRSCSGLSEGGVSICTVDDDPPTPAESQWASEEAERERIQAQAMLRQRPPSGRQPLRRHSKQAQRPQRHVRGVVSPSRSPPCSSYSESGVEWPAPEAVGSENSGRTEHALERGTINSTVSLVQANKVQSISGLDSLLTDNLFERFGLAAESRPTIDSNVSERSNGWPFGGSSHSLPASVRGLLLGARRDDGPTASSSSTWSRRGSNASVSPQFTNISGAGAARITSPELKSLRVPLPRAPLPSQTDTSGTEDPRAVPVGLPRRIARMPVEDLRHADPDSEASVASPGDGSAIGSDEESYGFSDPGAARGAEARVSDTSLRSATYRSMLGPAADGASPSFSAEDGLKGPFQVLRRPATMMSSAPSLMDAIRVQHEHMLIASHSQGVEVEQSLANAMEGARESAEAQEDPKSAFPSWVLATWGITPFRTGILWWAYAHLILIGVGMLVFGVVMLAMNARDAHSAYFHMTTGCTSCGAFLGLLFLRMRCIHNLLGPHQQPIELYASSFGFRDSWHVVSTRRFLAVLVLWVCSSLSHSIMNLHLGCPQSGDASIFACVINSCAVGGLCAVFFCKLHVCSALELAIDHYCLRLFESQDAATGTVQWNVLQALLRRAAHTLEGGFLAVSSAMLGVVVLTSAEILNVFNDPRRSSFRFSTVEDTACWSLWAGWVLPPTSLVFFAVFRAAAITEQCSRVPALVNSWMFPGRVMDLEKRYIVEYITHSAAGFYVRGVRLTATWALKLSYLCGVLLFSLLTQSVLKGG